MLKQKRGHHYKEPPAEFEKTSSCLDMKILQFKTHQNFTRTCSTFSSQRTSTRARQRGLRSISARGSSFPYLVTRQWYLQRKMMISFTSTWVCTHLTSIMYTWKAAPLRGSPNSNGWRISLRLLSPHQSPCCHLAVRLKEAWEGTHTGFTVHTPISSLSRKNTHCAIMRLRRSALV